MTKFAKCINNDYVNEELTVGKIYKVLHHDVFSCEIQIEDDVGNKTYYNLDRFSIQEEVDDYILNRKLNAIKDVVLFLANKQATKDVEEYELLKNLIDTLENEF